MKNKINLLLSFVLFSVLFTACGSPYEYSKTVRNETNQPLIVEYVCCSGQSTKSFLIEPGTESVIHICTYDAIGKAPGVTEPPLDIQVKTIDGALINTNITEPENWEEKRVAKSIECHYLIQNQATAVDQK